jgi:hypothetical protein
MGLCRDARNVAIDTRRPQTSTAIVVQSSIAEITSCKKFIPISGRLPKLNRLVTVIKAIEQLTQERRK